jgi:hypothetical protein
MKTVGDLTKKIVEMSGVDVESLPFGGLFVRRVYDDKEKLRVLTFRSNKPSPMDSGMLVFAMFHDEFETRVYLVPAGEGKDKPTDPKPPTRMVFDKGSTDYFGETFTSWDTFCAEMASELRVVDEATAEPADFEGEEPAPNGEAPPDPTEPQPETSDG